MGCVWHFKKTFQWQTVSSHSWRRSAPAASRRRRRRRRSSTRSSGARHCPTRHSMTFQTTSSMTIGWRAWTRMATTTPLPRPWRMPPMRSMCRASWRQRMARCVARRPCARRCSVRPPRRRNSLWRRPPPWRLQTLPSQSSCRRCASRQRHRRKRRSRRWTAIHSRRPPSPPPSPRTTAPSLSPSTLSTAATPRASCR